MLSSDVLQAIMIMQDADSGSGLGYLRRALIIAGASDYEVLSTTSAAGTTLAVMIITGNFALHNLENAVLAYPEKSDAPAIITAAIGAYKVAQKRRDQR